MDILFAVFIGRNNLLKAQNPSTELDDCPHSVYPSVFSNNDDKDVDVTNFYVIGLFRTDAVLQLHTV